MLFLRIRRRYDRQEGDLFKFYLVAYLGFRLVIYFIKPDFHPVLGLNAIPITCLLGILYYSASIPQMDGLYSICTHLVCSGWYYTLARFGGIIK